MKLSETLAEDIVSIEQQAGHKISDKAVSLIKAVAAKADSFTEIGRQHAAEGCPPWTYENFVEMGRPLGNPEGRDKPIVDLMYMSYMEGDNAGKETHHDSEGKVSDYGTELQND